MLPLTHCIYLGVMRAFLVSITKALLHKAIFFCNLQSNAVSRQVADELALVILSLCNTFHNKKLRCKLQEKKNRSDFYFALSCRVCNMYSAMLVSSLCCKLKEKLSCVNISAPLELNDFKPAIKCLLLLCFSIGPCTGLLSSVLPIGSRVKVRSLCQR